MSEPVPPAGTERSPPRLQVRGLCKRYAVNRVQANDGASLSVREGEIHALVGENGAGKTTLMKIVCGLERPDAGVILMRGRPASPFSPREALRLGAAMVHQHFRLIPELTVAENIILGEEPRRLGLFTDLPAARAATRRLAEEYGFDLDPRARVARLGLSRMQQVEIVKVLFRGADLVILDEPTTGLSDTQTTDLFSGLKRLAAGGRTIILITHRMKDVMDIADRVTVMRRGKTVSAGSTGGLTERRLSALVMGGEPPPELSRLPVNPGEPVYEFREVAMKSDRRGSLYGISFRIRRGEVFAITGIRGTGLEELEDLVSGLTRPAAGSIFHRGTDVSRFDPRRLRRRGMAFVPSNRLYRGVALEATVRDNLIVNRRRELERLGVLLGRRIAEFCRGLLNRLGTPPRLGLPIGTLSGGNIQKVILARELAAGDDFFLFSEPTWGVDAGSSVVVHNEILRLRNHGSAVLLVSTDLEEILSLSDRIAVLHGGRITSELINTGDLSRQAVGMAMLGASVRDDRVRRNGKEP